MPILIKYNIGLSAQGTVPIMHTAQLHQYTMDKVSNAHTYEQIVIEGLTLHDMGLNRRTTLRRWVTPMLRNLLQRVMRVHTTNTPTATWQDGQQSVSLN